MLFLNFINKAKQYMVWFHNHCRGRCKIIIAIAIFYYFNSEFHDLIYFLFMSIGQQLIIYVFLHMMPELITKLINNDKFIDAICTLGIYVIGNWIHKKKQDK